MSEAVSPIDPYAGLNPAQRAAVIAGDGPLLVVAGAGTGKTHTLAQRLGELVVRGVDPQRLLLLTFSRRAAAELERRAAQVLAQRLGRGTSAALLRLPYAGTFHSVGARLLRAYAERIGLDPAFTILDRGDAADLMGWVRQEAGLAEAAQRFPTKDTCLAIYSRSINSAAALSAVLSDVFPWCANWEGELRRLFDGYAKAKADQHVLDYDDLILYWSEMLTVPALAAELEARFSHVLIDEYQDTNALQGAIVTALKPNGSGVTVVGDDAQAIYSFRAATVRNILDFPRQFSSPVTTILLEENYRSTAPLLAASNAVIALARERHTKTLTAVRAGTTRPRLVTVADEAAQAEAVALGVLARREAGLRLRQQAVLFRTSSHSAPLELELARRRIPFVKFGGLKFLEASHVKDLVAVLRWAENPRARVTGFRVAQLVPGIGPVTAARLFDLLAGSANPTDALAAVPVPSAARPEWNGLVDLMTRLWTSPVWPSEFELVRHWYQPHLERLHEDAAARTQDLEQLGRLAGQYGTRERFVTELTLDPPELSSDEAQPPSRDEDWLVLSTIHSAKGREWPAVSVLNVVDGCIPSDMGAGTPEELEEERRLLYVAMTRARDQLDLYVPQRFYVHHQPEYGDRHAYALRSRFIPVSVATHFEPAHWPPRAEADGEGAPTGSAGARVAVDLAARLATRWRS